MIKRERTNQNWVMVDGGCEMSESGVLGCVSVNRTHSWKMVVLNCQMMYPDCFLGTP
jgi:hypothetical protein